MKHLAKFAALAMAVCLWSCSDDLPEKSGNEELRDGMYATITLNLPTGSRSATIDPNNPENGGINDDPTKPNVPSQSNQGYEIGNPNENAVNTITVVLAVKKAEGDYLPIAAATTHSPENVSAVRPTYVLRFNTSDITEKEEAIADAERKVYVFAYCNAPSGITGGIEDNFSVDATTDISAGSEAPLTPGNPIGIPEIARNNSTSGDPSNFMMTNALLAQIELPSQDALSAYNKGNPLDLGMVSVERVVSRLDFKQTTIIPEEPNVYPIAYNEQPLARVTLVGMALFNESKTFYVFPRVSDNGFNTSNSTPTKRPAGWELCGIEYFGRLVEGNYMSNYVVSTNAREKATYAGESNQNYAGWFFYPTISATATVGVWPELFDYTYINSANVPNVDDIHDTSYDKTYLWGEDGGRYEGYKIWRYVTENTLPVSTNQRNGISTGVYFKAQLSVDPNANSAEAKAIAKAMNNNRNFYAYSSILFTEKEQNNYANVNEIFGDIDATYNYCKEHQETDLAQNFKSACIDGLFQIVTGKEVDSNGKVTNEGTSIGAITAATDIYQDGYAASDANLRSNRNSKLNKWGFYCYYPTREGQNYKYYCYYPYYIRHNDNGDNFKMGPMEFATVRNNIYKLQVTNISRIGLPGDTPPDPGTPDEADDIYMKVAVQVLDWVVRINNIEY